MMRAPQALTATVATFATSWRDSNCTVRAGDHRNKRAIKIKIVEIKNKCVLGVHLTHHHGVGLSQPRPGGVGFFLSSEEGSLRELEADLKLTVLPSYLEVTVLGHPLFLEEASGVITGVGVGGFR